MFGLLYLTKVSVFDNPSPAPDLKNLRIASFHESDFRIFFVFGKSEAKLLMDLLRFPNFEVSFPNRGKMHGEEIFLRGLDELVSGENKFKIARNVFWRCYTYQSRAFSWFVDHIYNNFHHLLHDNLDWWWRNNFFQASNEAINSKLRVDYVSDVAFFIDCNCLRTTMPGGGPGEDGANAARWCPFVQQAFYNGWKSIHGLKHQTVDIAHGFTVDMLGPYSLRRNDLALLRDSNINERLAQLQAGESKQYIIFGDSAYKTQSHIRSYYGGQQERSDPRFRRWNGAMKAVRIAIEWNYAITGSLFKYLANKRKLQLLKSSTRVSKIYTVATLLRNCYVGLYGSQVSKYFEISVPNNFVVNYLSQTDMDM